MKRVAEILLIPIILPIVFLFMAGMAIFASEVSKNADRVEAKRREANGR